MTSSNIATVFAPCLLPPPNKAEMSEMRLELRVLVLRTFIESPHLFGKLNHFSVLLHSFKWGSWKRLFRSSHSVGVIPKTVMDSMDFLINFHPLKDAKRCHRKRHGLKGITLGINEKWNANVISLFRTPHLLKYPQWRGLRRRCPGFKGQRTGLQPLRGVQSPPQQTEYRSGEASAWRLSPTSCCSEPACRVQVNHV